MSTWALQAHLSLLNSSLTLNTTVFPGYVNTAPSSSSTPSAADATKDLPSFPPFLVSLKSPKANSKVLPAPTTTWRRAAEFAADGARRVCVSDCGVEGRDEVGVMLVGRLAASCFPWGEDEEGGFTTIIVDILDLAANPSTVLLLLVHAAAGEGRKARGEAVRQVNASNPGKQPTSSSRSKDRRGRTT